GCLVGLALLVFLTVCMSILVGHQLVSALLSRDAERVKQRMVDEFGQPKDEVITSPLYKNLEQLSLDGGVASILNGAPPIPPKPAAMDRLAAWMEGAGLAWTPLHLFALMSILALIAGLIASWFGGRIAGPIAALVAAIAPLVYVDL